jgi:pyruvate dehydrogenase E2 component (dihydrolipoamide acetyltransferase)
VRWLVTEGDPVVVDQCVVEVETAKSVVEVPSPYAGRVETLHARPGATVAVGQPLITVSAPDRESAPAGGSGNVLIGYGTSGETTTGRRRRPRANTRPAAPAFPDRQVPLVISPLVRNLARAKGVDLSTVQGTGDGGVILRADVERAAAPSAAGRPAGPSSVGRAAGPSSVAPAAAPAAVAPAAPGERRIPLNGFRRTVAAALTRSRAEIPEATVWVDVDATRLWQLRASAPAGPGLIAYVARFVVAALREYPVFNARLDTERQEIVEFDRIDLGIAVQGARGLVVPAVIGAEAMTTARLDEEIRRLTASAREGRTTPAELAAGTFTLNNYGAFRVDGSAAIINHPQVAILGLGRVIDRPWVVDGQLEVRKIAQMSFVFDHRVCDGGTAAGFMRSVADAVEDPASVIARL